MHIKEISGKLQVDNNEFSWSMNIITAEHNAMISKVDKVLSNQERTRYESLYPLRQQSFLLGRYALKSALSHFQPSNFNQIEINSGVFGQPIIMNLDLYFHASIAHTGKRAAGLVSSIKAPMTVDMETVDESRLEVLYRQFGELEYNAQWGLSRCELYFLYWTAAEAMSKYLLGGLNIDLALLKPDKVIYEQGNLYLTNHHFPFIKCLAFKSDNVLGVIAYPLKSCIKTTHSIFNFQSNEVIYES